MRQLRTSVRRAWYTFRSTMTRAATTVICRGGLGFVQLAYAAAQQRTAPQETPLG